MMSVPHAVKPPESAARRVTGFLPPLATPFKDGAIDLESLKRLMDDIAPHVAGYLVGGSVGEVASLTIEEREQIMRAAAAAASPEHRLAMSISDNSIVHSQRLADLAGELGADLLMVSCPNYFANDREMLVAYFAALSEFAGVDICIYDNPIASQTQLSIEDLCAIEAGAPRVTHIKVTDTSIDKVSAVRAATALVVHAGDDAVLWHQLSRGAEGAMVALPMIYPEVASAVWRAFQDGDLEAAYREYAGATRFFHISLGAPDFVGVVKTVLEHRGVIASAEMRLPLIPLTPARTAEIVASL
jgi:4-hydroxy-tetrahydrodipicolinate synthase